MYIRAEVSIYRGFLGTGSCILGERIYRTRLEPEWDGTGQDKEIRKRERPRGH